MRKLFSSIFFFVAITAGVFAQGSIKDALSFYPLAKGNYWEYVHVLGEMTPPYQMTIRYTSKEVTGDTTIAGKKYFIIESRDLADSGNYWYVYERIDTALARVYRYVNEGTIAGEFLVMDFMTEIDSVFPGTYWFPTERDKCKFNMEYNRVILGKDTRIKEFIDQTILPASTYSFAQGYGVLGNYGRLGFEGSGDIVFCSLNGKESGKRIVSVNDNTQPADILFELASNYPNPFNPSTTISYNIAADSKVSLVVYNAIGQRQSVLFDGILNTGKYTAIFNAEGLPSGIYICRLSAKPIENGKMFTKNIKMLLLK